MSMQWLSTPCRKCRQPLVCRESDGSWEWLHCYGCGDVIYDRSDLPASASSTEQCGTRKNAMTSETYDRRSRIGDLVHIARTERGMSMKDVQRATGVPATTVSSIELGLGGDKPRGKLMEYFGVTC
jgi:ribosome-binding protein aMBF1 (putative translation factor)